MIELNEEQKTRLLQLARDTIAEELGLESSPRVPDLSDEVFGEKCGAFVTLHIEGQLRGCIGYIVGIKNIPDTIREMAVSAAFRDPRFPALTAKEYPGIDIEISVLTPVVAVSDVSEIETGRDGIIISNGYNQGLLLPQVATEYGWDRETFLQHTCFKAGLPGNAWKDPATRIEKFSAIVFGEKELGLV